MRVTRYAGALAALVAAGMTVAFSQPRFGFPMPKSGDIQSIARICELLGLSNDQRSFINSMLSSLKAELNDRFLETSSAIIDECRRIPIKFEGGQLRVLDGTQAVAAIDNSTSLVLDYVDDTVAAVDSVLHSTEFTGILADLQLSRLDIIRSAAGRRIRLDAAATVWPGATNDPVLVLLSAFDAHGRLDDPVLLALTDTIIRGRSPELDRRARIMFETSVESTGQHILAVSTGDRNSPAALLLREAAVLSSGEAEREWIATSNEVMNEMLGLFGNDPIGETVRAAWFQRRYPISTAGEDSIALRLQELESSLTPEDKATSTVQSISVAAEMAFSRLRKREDQWRSDGSKTFTQTAAHKEAFEQSMWGLRKQRAEEAAARLRELAQSHPNSPEITRALEWALTLRAELDALEQINDWPIPRFRSQ